jgi:hypothetical protein
MKLGIVTIEPLDLASAQRRVRELLGIDKTKCSFCGALEGVESEIFIGLDGSEEESILLCRKCATLQHAKWDELWDAYRTGHM